MTNYSKRNFENHQPAKEINLKELIGIISRRYWIVIIVTLLFILAGYLKTLTTTPLYQASTRIIIEANQDKMKTLQVIIKDTTVLQKVINEMELSMSPEALAGAIDVTSVEDSEVVSISVTASEPYMAANIANTTARVFKNEAPNIVDFKNIRNLSSAKVDLVPINGDNSGTIIKSGIIGLFLGIGLTFLLNSLDYTIRSEQEVEDIIGFPVIGHVSKMNKKNSNVSKRNIQQIKEAKHLNETRAEL
ncbi:YveK family protein [Peribacillus sp. RS7]|uniref:YveK family protein n=1 Tax=Peribacillus TaxID=2675229 RepID=UPI00259FE192|nr:Wzz/FepE/Etk N-terminal domain-containing protein [Peribacillus sp. NJ11]MDM5222776.1 Wzz/FepE/Etk N-terminal domain-containing protein [Peribacillus sp. NJ11]